MTTYFRNPWYRSYEPATKSKFFRYAPDVKISDASCKLCSYQPEFTVDNPMKCLRDHIRRVHREVWMREYRRTYIIREYP